MLQNLWKSFLSFFTNIWLVSDKEYASMPPLFHIDDYDNCLLYGTKALFCGIGFRLSPRNPNNTSGVWKTIWKLTQSRKYYNHDLLRHGVCVPKQCPNIDLSKFYINNITMSNTSFIEELGKCYSSKFKSLDVAGKLEFIRCETSESPYNFNMVDLFTCVCLVAFIALVLYASIYDIFWSPDFSDQNFRQSTFGQYISSFSISKNWERLTKVDLSDRDTKALSSIQGVRFYSLCGVIFCHTGTFNVSLPTLNPRYIEAMMDRKFEQFIGMGGRHTTLQAFFVMMSFLHSYKFFIDNEGKSKIPFSYLVKSFFSRYFRLTPMVALVTIFVSTLMPHLSRGPLWDYVIGDEYRVCRSNWWNNIVYLNNFSPLHEMCLPHAWSLSVDLQFYALGLLILWLMWNCPNKVGIIVGSVLAYHVTQTFFSFYKKVAFIQISPEFSYNTTLVNLNDFLLLYKATTTNIAGFITGIFFGYLFYRCRNIDTFTKKWHVTTWWLVSWGAMILTTIFPGFFIHLASGTQYHDLIFAIYMAVGRAIYSFGIALFIFGMTQGQGHIFKSFCEWPVLYVLGRLNFNAYLIHVVIQRFVTGLKRTPNFLSDYIIIYEALSYLALSYIGAALLTLFFEYPFVEIKKHVTSFMRRKNVLLDETEEKKAQ